MSLGVDHVRLRGKGEQAVRGDRADIACGDHPQGDLGGQEGRQVVEDALAEYRPTPRTVAPNCSASPRTDGLRSTESVRDTPPSPRR